MRADGDSILAGNSLQRVHPGTDAEIQRWILRVCDQQAPTLQPRNDAAAEAKAEAERELADRTGEMEVAEAQAKLLEAVAQLQALERLRKNLKR